MTEEVLANLYKIEIPLPRNPLKALNSYAIKSPERNLIIDTGWNQQECMDAMQVGLKELEIDIRENRLFYYAFTYRSFWPHFESYYRYLEDILQPARC